MIDRRKPNPAPPADLLSVPFYGPAYPASAVGPDGKTRSFIGPSLRLFVASQLLGAYGPGETGSADDDVLRAVNMADKVIRAADTVPANADGDRDGTLGYARKIATKLYEKHWKTESPGWQAARDMLGLLTQIDDMVATLERSAPPAQRRDQATTIDSGFFFNGKPVEQLSRREAIAAAIEFASLVDKVSHKKQVLQDRHNTAMRKLDELQMQASEARIAAAQANEAAAAAEDGGFPTLFVVQGQFQGSRRLHNLPVIAKTVGPVTASVQVSLDAIAGIVGRGREVTDDMVEAALDASVSEESDLRETFDLSGEVDDPVEVARRVLQAAMDAVPA